MVLAQGSRGPQVKHLQELLNTHLKPSPGLVPDGIFGPLTEAAVCSYQKAAHLHVSGRVDAATWARLESRRRSAGSRAQSEKQSDVGEGA